MASATQPGGDSTLTPEQKRETRRLWEQGLGYKAITAEIGAKYDQVCDFCKTRMHTWDHTNRPPAQIRRRTDELTATLVCSVCGTQFARRPGSRGRPPKECPSCRRAPVEVVVLHCLWCGKRFEHGGKQGTVPKYCCPEHRIEANATAAAKRPRYFQREPRQCIVCGKDYTPSWAGQKCCSVAHSRIMQINSARKNNLATCAHCGKEFVAKIREGKRQIYCCREHAFAARSRDMEHNIAGKSVWKPLNNDTRHRRRAKRFGAVYERIKPLDIYQRDNWICGICGQPVQPELRYPHPECATLDHIVPLSKGGSHTQDNVQLAHLRCNIAKSDSVDETPNTSA